MNNFHAVPENWHFQKVFVKLRSAASRKHESQPLRKNERVHRRPFEDGTAMPFAPRILIEADETIARSASKLKRTVPISRVIRIHCHIIRVPSRSRSPD